MGLTEWFHVKPPALTLVTSENAESWLAAIDPKDEKELAADLFQFGNLLLSQVSTLTGAIEAKAIAILGWSIALLGFLVLTPGWLANDNWAAAGLTLWTIGWTVLSLVASFLAASARDWQWPSQQDWLNHALFSEPIQLRQYWLIAILEAHTAHATQNRRKAACLVVAQWAIVLAGLGFATIVTVRLLLGHG